MKFKLVAQNKQNSEVWDWRSVIFQGFWVKKSVAIILTT